MTELQPDIVIVTSPLHAGKSSLIARYADLCGKHNIRVAGIIAEGLWKNNQRSGFNLIDLSCGRCVPLAFRCPPREPACVGFDFYPEGIEAARAALDPDLCAKADLIVVDEVGKLEIMAGGWALYLMPLLRLAGKTHIWAVRDSLVEAVTHRWRFTPRAVVDAWSPDALNELISACALFD